MRTAEFMASDPSTTPESIDAARPQSDRGAAGIFNQLERIGDVDIGGLAIGQDNDEFPEASGMADELAGMTKRSAEPRRQAGRQRSRSFDAVAVVGFIEGLDRRHFDVVAPVRCKGQHAEGIAKRAHGFGQHRNRKALGVEGWWRRRPDGRELEFGNVEQQQHREIAVLRGGGAKNPRIWLLTHPQRDTHFEHDIDVQIVTIELSLQADS